MAKSTMVCAGIDTGKRRLDGALGGSDERLQVDNGPAGHARLSGWLRRHRVERVGIEASGGYEGAVVAQLRRDGFAAAFHWNDQLKRCYRRLILAGKAHKVALVACARKLLIYANTVVARGTPWCANHADHAGAP